jgi:hypothetical protein
MCVIPVVRINYLKESNSQNTECLTKEWLRAFKNGNRMQQDRKEGQDEDGKMKLEMI